MIIQGELFKKVADFTFAPEVKVKDDYDNLESTFNPLRVFDGCVVYTHTMYVKSLFQILSQLNNTFTVITHNSDDNIDETYQIPKNVIKWYTTNVNVINQRIESIPIGLENSRWFKKDRKIEKIQASMLQNHSRNKLLYVNHNVNTNPSKRQKPMELFENKSWATVEKGKNGSDFDNYLQNLMCHKFMICPEGNGIDTHRTWECLYAGCIPIEKRNINNQYYQDLPILFVDEWEEINEKFLKDSYIRIKSNLYNFGKLNFEYWKNKIKSR